MSDGVYVALSGAIAQAATLDSTSTNLANVTTDGYQRIRPVFREALARARGGASTGCVEISRTSLDTTRGALRVTGRALDVVLPDNSYLSVSTERGERFTRAGKLAVGSDGVLKTSHGNPVLGEDDKPIRAQQNGVEVKIAPSGEVSQGDGTLGRLRLISFPSPDQLAPEGSTLLNATPAAGAPSASKGQLQVGSLEESNASVIGAMTDMVSASRSFDAFQRAIDAFRQADTKVVTTVPGDQ
jgi:flagellar basal-body rod protein FlgF